MKAPNTLKPDLNYKPKLQPGVFPHEGWWAGVQMMANRMSMSQQKYGDIEGVKVSGSRTIESLEQRLFLYKETGNTEWLLDVANMALIEHICPQHPDAHFRATGSEESPGLVGL